MSEEKKGQQYLAALHQAFPGVVLEESWQTKDQITVTVKVNYLPEVVEFLYYQQGGWLSVLFGNDESQLCGSYAVYYVMSMEQGEKCWITVRVEVYAERNPADLQVVKVTEANLTYVAIDSAGKPRAIAAQ